MDIETLKNRIVECNKLYRSGNGSPISDIEYDNLLEELSESVSEDEFNDFKTTLNEGMVEYGEKVKHCFIAGSLNKLKYDEPESVMKFIKKHVGNKLSVSAKVDGISGILHYSEGKLVGFATRGNGYEGINILNKAEYINGIPTVISNKDDIFIRGELVILKSNYGSMDGTSARNVCAGLINKKQFSPTEMKNVDFIAYTIMGPKYCKVSQFEELEYNGFNTAWHVNIDSEECLEDNFVDTLFDYASQEFDYQTDGLVISDTEYRNEDEYYPNNQAAFKINQQTFNTRLIDVEWQGPSKNGVMAPVGILEPVNIGGVVVGKCTLNNIDYINEKGIKIGDIVSILRSGDVIPRLLSVVSTDENSVEIDIPKNCPCCGSELVKEGPFVYCKNEDCTEKTTREVQCFIKNLGIENASFKTLSNFGIYTIEDLLKFKPNEHYKNEMKLGNELEYKLFGLSDKDIFCALNMKDIGMKTLKVIINHYGWNHIVTCEIDSNPLIDLPDNVGDITMNKFMSCYKKNLAYVDMVKNDIRYHYSASSENNKEGEKKTEVKGSICVTGSINSFKNRDEFLKMASDYGYESKSGVSKGLTYLVNNDIESTSSKNKKAKSLGIPIVSEDEFLKIIGYVKVDDL